MDEFNIIPENLGRSYLGFNAMTYFYSVLSFFCESIFKMNNTRSMKPHGNAISGNMETPWVCSLYG